MNPLSFSVHFKLMVIILYISQIPIKLKMFGFKWVKIFLNIVLCNMKTIIILYNMSKKGSIGCLP